jgi:hypothetical protein
LCENELIRRGLIDTKKEWKISRHNKFSQTTKVLLENLIFIYFCGKKRSKQKEEKSGKKLLLWDLPKPIFFKILVYYQKFSRDLKPLENKICLIF